MELRQKAQYHKKLQELVITSKFELGFNDSVVESRSCYGRILLSKLSRIGCLLRKDWRVPACLCLFWLHEPDCSFQALSGWQKSWRCGWSSVFSRVIGTRKGLVARQVFVPGIEPMVVGHSKPNRYTIFLTNPLTFTKCCHLNAMHCCTTVCLSISKWPCLSPFTIIINADCLSTTKCHDVDLSAPLFRDVDFLWYQISITKLAMDAMDFLRHFAIQEQEFYEILIYHIGV